MLNDGKGMTDHQKLIKITLKGKSHRNVSSSLQSGLNLIGHQMSSKTAQEKYTVHLYLCLCEDEELLNEDEMDKELLWNLQLLSEVR